MRYSPQPKAPLKEIPLAGHLPQYIITRPKRARKHSTTKETHPASPAQPRRFRPPPRMPHHTRQMHARIAPAPLKHLFSTVLTPPRDETGMLHPGHPSPAKPSQQTTTKSAAAPPKGKHHRTSRATP